MKKGHDYIFSDSYQKSIDKQELIGEENVLNSKVIEQAFEFILQDYHPHHENVIFGLCTKTRPYNLNPKWKLLNDCFGNCCDLIICSNGGIIPIEYANCFPFLEYDAPHEDTNWDDLYNEIFIRRLTKFLDTFHYKKIIFNFVPTTRNYRAVESLHIGKLIPHEQDFDKEEGYLGMPVTRYPLCKQSIFLEIEAYLGIKSIYLHELIDKYTNLVDIKICLSKLVQSLSKNTGYSFKELCDKLSSIAPAYSTVYIQKTIKASIDNVAVRELKTHDKYFHKEGDLIYLIGSTKIRSKKKLF